MRCFSVLVFWLSVRSASAFAGSPGHLLSPSYQRTGSYTWEIPEGVDAVTLELVGGGGKAWIEEKWGPEQVYPFQHVERCGFGNFCKKTPAIQGRVKIHCVGCTPNPYQVVLCNWEGVNVRVNDATPIEIPEHALLHCEGINPMKQDIVVQRFERTTHQSVGGGAGQVVMYTIKNLHANDVLSIYVGAGTNADGQDTTVTVNGQTYIAKGGRKESAGDISGERGSAQSSSLLGMGGRASTTPEVNGEIGFDGAVTITYHEPTQVEMIKQAAELAQIFADRVTRYARNFADGLESQDPMIEACIEAAVEMNGDLASALLRVKRLSKKSRETTDELSEATKIFEKLLFETIAQHPELASALLSENTKIQAEL